MRLIGTRFVLLAFALSSPLLAQEQRGAIEGTVRDPHDAVTPGAVVRVQSPTGLSVEVVADASGTYRFASLPPGRYELTATRFGFIPARVVNVDLRLGMELHIDVRLQTAGVAETVEVVGESPLVAVTQSARATSLREEQIQKMPRARDFTSLATQVAGANSERKLGGDWGGGSVGISIDGAAANENRVLIDGVETTDLLLGMPGQYLVTDFVEELQVKSSGYSAEYGGSTGGVLNAITRSGTNDWHGAALLYWSGDALDSGPRPTLRLNPEDPSRAEYVTYPEDEYHQLEPGLTLSGPLVRDKLWFFAGYVPLFWSLDRTVTFLADGSSGTFRQELRRHHGALNPRAQLGPRWRARAAFSTGHRTTSGWLPALDGTSNPEASYSHDDVLPNYSVSVNVDYTPSSRVLLSLRAGYFFNNYYDEGIYQGDRYRYATSAVGFPGVPLEYQQPRLYQNVPTNYSYDRHAAPRLGVQLDGTFFFTAAGEHQTTAGVSFDRLGLDSLEGETGNDIQLYWGQGFYGQAGPFGYYRVRSNPLFPNRGSIIQGEAWVNNVGIFVRDAWRIGGRLTLNLGLRTENEHIPSVALDPDIPKTAIHFGFGDKLAPRVGFAWDATGDRRTKVYGSWGVFYDIMKLWMPLNSFGGQKATLYWYTLDDGDISSIIDNPDCPPACPGSLILGPLDLLNVANDPENNTIDPDIRPMRLQEAVVGVERELRSNLSVQARYVHKQVDRAVEDIGTLGENQSPIYTIGNPGFGRAASFYPEGGTTLLPFPKAKRSYDAVEIALDRRLSNRWAGRVSYTWSRLWGNYSGLAQSDEDGRVAPNVGWNFDYPLMSFDERGEPVYGVLATDRTHQVKAHVLLDFAFGTSVGASWFGASGLPRTRLASFIQGLNLPVMYLGRNSDGRLPFLSRLDLYAQHQVRLGARAHLTVSANVINLLNQGTATNYYPHELYSGQAVQVEETEFYQGIDTRALIAEQGLVRDARFLLASEYEAPRSIRLGVRLGF